jgi:hypothetical protein
LIHTLLGWLRTDDLSEVEEIIQRNLNERASWSRKQRAILLQLQGYMNFMLGGQNAAAALEKWIEVWRMGFDWELGVS